MANYPDLWFYNKITGCPFSAFLVISRHISQDCFNQNVTMASSTSVGD